MDPVVVQEAQRGGNRRQHSDLDSCGSLNVALQNRAGNRRMNVLSARSSTRAELQGPRGRA